MRVVSLVPSVTETLLAWDVEPIACTRFCEQPSLRHVGGTKDPDIEAIVALAPDVVVVDREENRRDDADELIARGVRVIDLHVTHVEGALTETRRLAEIVGVNHEPPALPIVVEPAVRVFVPIWRKPWMTISAATYGASLLASIGLEVSHHAAVDTYPEVGIDELGRLAASKDVRAVLLPTEPYAFAERHVAEIAKLTNIDDVRIIDGRDLFWWGVRTHGARERLAVSLADLLV